MKTLKEKVLQKCAELCQTRNGVCWYIDDQTWISVRDNGPYKINSGSGSVKIGVSQNTPESDPVWPLAAQALGIGEGDSQPKEHQVSFSMNGFRMQLVSAYQSLCEELEVMTDKDGYIRGQSHSIKDEMDELKSLVCCFCHVANPEMDQFDFLSDWLQAQGVVEYQPEPNEV